MKKITSLLMMFMLFVGMGWAQTEAAPANGVYKIFWEHNSRGYLTYAFGVTGDIYQTEAQLADVTLSGCENKHFNTATDGDKLDLRWYVYTSSKGNTYFFTFRDGKFVGIGTQRADAGVSNLLSAQPTAMKIYAHSVGNNHVYAQAGNKLFGSGCGSDKGTGHPVRWNNADQLADGGTPFKFVAVTENGWDQTEVYKNAVNAINSYENLDYIAEIKTLSAQVDELLTMKGVGYPTDVQRNLLVDAKNNANANASAESCQTLKEAIETYKTTHDVVLPEPGKMYTFTAVDADGNRFYLNNEKHSIQLVERTEIPLDALQGAQFLCNKTADGKYVFVSNVDNYYLAFFGTKGSEGVNGGSGLTASFDEKYSPLQVVSLSEYGMGFVGIKGKCDNNESESFLILRKDGRAHRDGTGRSYFDPKGSENGCPRTSAILIEEAPSNGNIVVFSEIRGNAITGLEAGSKIATCDPIYAAEIPAGVKAYYVTEAGENSAKLVELTEGIPAGEGVILVSKENQAVILPAVSVVNPLNGKNLLKGTGGNSVYMAEGDYVLAHGEDGTQFYKAKVGSRLSYGKAYLHLSVAAASKLSLNFGGETTGIEAVEAENANAPIYDLSGRRVNSTVKGGIYIQNGKKFIVK